MGYLETALRALEIDPNPEIKLEIYKRFYLAPKLWFSFFEGEEKELARKAFGDLLKDTYGMDEGGYACLIAEGLEGKYIFNQFILDHYDKWMEVVKYLAYGNGDIERSFSEDIYRKSKEAALRAISADLYELLKI